MLIDNSTTRFAAIFLTLVLTAISAFSQTGGTYEIEKSVIASGGNTSSGGNFTLESTSGQTVSNASPQGGAYQILSGFWTPVFAPSAASVTVSGKVSQSGGNGISQATVRFTDGDGIVRTARTSSFGYFQFEEVEVGQTYIFEVSARRYIFAPQVVTVFENVAGLNFATLGK